MTEKENTHGHERGDLLPVLDQLHTDTLADGRVWLFCLDADFFEDDALCVGRASCRAGLVDVAECTLFVGFVRLCVVNVVVGRQLE